jgi:hypothetical protein
MGRRGRRVTIDARYHTISSDPMKDKVRCMEVNFQIVPNGADMAVSKVSERLTKRKH